MNNKKTGYIFLINTLVKDTTLDKLKQRAHHLIIYNEMNKRTIYNLIKKFILTNDYTNINLIIVSIIRNYKLQIFSCEKTLLNSFVDDVKDSCYNKYGKYLESLYVEDAYININDDDDDDDDIYNKKKNIYDYKQIDSNDLIENILKAKVVVYQ